MLLRLTMLPWPLAAIPGASAATRKNGARTLLANILSNAATSNSAVAAKTDIPALLMRMSTSPASLARRGTSVASLRSAPTKLALPPAAVISSTVSAPRAASRPWTRTSAPSRGEQQRDRATDDRRRARHQRALPLQVILSHRRHGGSFVRRPEAGSSPFCGITKRNDQF